MIVLGTGKLAEADRFSEGVAVLLVSPSEHDFSVAQLTRTGRTWGTCAAQGPPIETRLAGCRYRWKLRLASVGFCPKVRNHNINQWRANSMKLRVFGWLVVGCLIYVCPSAMAQSSLSADVLGSVTTDAKIAGVAVGSANWAGTGKCTVSPAGDVDCKIKGLVLPSDGGSTGPVTGVGAGLVCDGILVGTTASSPLSSKGDAKIKGTITGLPASCPAPIILIEVLEASGSAVPPGTVYIGLSGVNFSSSTTEVHRADWPGDR